MTLPQDDYSNQTYEDLYTQAYVLLKQSQFPSGEFGRLAQQDIAEEDSFRHGSTDELADVESVLRDSPDSEHHQVLAQLRKPNCSISLIAIEGISRFTGKTDPVVRKAVDWFTRSHNVQDGWFRRAVHFVDDHPYRGEYKITWVPDIRHTATALLAALKFGGSMNFIIKAVTNLLEDRSRDIRGRGWKTSLDDLNGRSDFYATIFVLAVLDYLESSNFLAHYSLDINQFDIGRVINEGLTEICSKPPSKLGYNESKAQTLRANGALLFFLGPLLIRKRPEYLNMILDYICDSADVLGDEASWLGADFAATVDICAGLSVALAGSSRDDRKLLEQARRFIATRFVASEYNHPATLGFILYIFSKDPIKSSEFDGSTKGFQERGVEVTRKTKVLFLAANPTDTTRLRLDDEIRAIDQALRQAEYRDKFDIRQHWAVRVGDIQEILLRHKPDIVHFSGHGSNSSEIILEDRLGNSQPVPVDALSDLFYVLKDNIRCVVLNACYSEQQAQAIAKHIDCVVGMSRAIGDRSAISLATSFYRALGYGRDVETAFKLGCMQINLENLGEQDRPKLLAIRVKPTGIVFVHND